MKTPPECDRHWEIDALREGTLGPKDAEAFERHARGCSDCTAALAQDARLRELAASLPSVAPNELALRRLRGKVLHDVATGAAVRRWRYPILRLAVAALFLFVFAGWGLARWRSSPTASREAPSLEERAPRGLAGEVTPFAGARWTQVREGLVETVRLDDGTLRIRVRRQTTSERFLVVLPDGELEVRGTRFEVTVRGDATSRVAVEEGKVALHLAAVGGEIELAAGQSWSAPVPGSLPPVEAQSAGPAAKPQNERAHERDPRPTPRRASVATPGVAVSALPADGGAEPAADDGADAYVAAITLLQSGRYGPAASAFHAFGIAHPRAPQIEDASFLEAAALAQAGRTDAAALVAEHHLARFPSSFHRKEAAVLIARAARDRGDCAQARAILAPWLGSLGSAADPQARATLETCVAREAHDE